MDKRSALFVISLSLTLFLVSLYFQQQNQESVKVWNEQQAGKRTQKILTLESQIKEQSIKTSELPLVNLYLDNNGQTLWTEGVFSGDAVLAIENLHPAPEKVFAKIGDRFQEMVRLQEESKTRPLVLFGKTKDSKLTIGQLPEFGSYSLQVITPSFGGEQPSVTVGEYTDGHFTLLEERVVQLKKELNPESRPISSVSTDSFILLKSAKGYLPVAYYNPSFKTTVYLNGLEDLFDLTTKAEGEKSAAIGQKTSEKFYVLENEYQQLVFSNYGGSLVEINLPFTSKDDPKSVVKEIGFDRDMVKDHPYNAYFPAHEYQTAGKSLAGPFVTHAKGALGGYYPLLRRDLIEVGKRKSVRIPPKFYALNIISEYPEMAELVFEVKSFDDKQIVFEANQNHRKITKTYSIVKEAGAPYAFDLTIQVEGDARGLWLTSGIPEVEWISGAPAPALKLRTTRNGKSEVESLSLPSDSITVSSAAPDWVCTSNGFFGVILDPLSEIDYGYRAQTIAGPLAPSRLVEIGQDYERFDSQKLPGYMMMLPLKSSGGIMHFRVFAGPFSDSILKKVDAYYDDAATGYNPDYISCQSFHGWFSFISEPFAKFLFVLMKFFYQLTGSWAFSIILLTIALRIMLYPLNAWSMKSMYNMQQIAPEVTAIQEKNKKDPKKAQQEIMALYQKRGVNPVSGCLPLLIQMPFLIGMFDLLKSTFELRGASFIPGWIDNLTAPDVLFSWETPIFFIGNEFHLLPIILGAVMFMQQRLTSTLPKDPALLTDQQRQQKAMGTLMTVFFTIMFYNFPSGLNIYWLSSMLLGMAQQLWMQKTLKSRSQTIEVSAKK